MHDVFEAILSERVAGDQEASALILKKRAVSIEHLCLNVHQALFQWQKALACCPGTAAFARRHKMHKPAPEMRTDCKTASGT